MDQPVSFGYRCQECGRGTVRGQVFPEYATKIKGRPFVVQDALIGVCEVCGAKHFSAKECKRWEGLFAESAGA